MAAPDRKFEVGNDYKMYVRPSRGFAAARDASRLWTRGGADGTPRDDSTGADTGPYGNSDSVDVIGEGAYGVVWCVRATPSSPVVGPAG